jgi:hypothetical protein
MMLTAITASRYRDMLEAWRRNVRSVSIGHGGVVEVSVAMWARGAGAGSAVVGARDAGFATVSPCQGSMPDASNLNCVAGQTVPDSVISKLGSSGEVCLFTSGATDMLVDIVGQSG